MKIEIEKFNFISDTPHDITQEFNQLKQYLYYFYLKDKNNTMFFYGRHRDGKLEEKVGNKYRMVNICEDVEKQINEFIKKQVEERKNKYSVYDLYKGFSPTTIDSLREKSKFNLEHDDKYVPDLKLNKIYLGVFQYNPYTEKVENLDDLFKQGFFKKQIYSILIQKEIESGIAPPYIYEYKKIMDFLKNKESVTLIFKDFEKFKVKANVSNFLCCIDNDIRIRLPYLEERSFLRANPGKDEKMLNINDLKGISYGKNILEIDNKALKNISKQLSEIDKNIEKKQQSLKKDINDYSEWIKNKITEDLTNGWISKLSYQFLMENIVDLSEKCFKQLKSNMTLEEELNMIDKNISNILKERPEYIVNSELENEQESDQI